MQRRELERLQNEAGAELNEEERGFLRKLADRLRVFAGYLRDGLKRLGRGDRATRAALEAKAEDVYALAEMFESAAAMTAAELRQARKITNAPPTGETKYAREEEDIRWISGIDQSVIDDYVEKAKTKSNTKEFKKYAEVSDRLVNDLKDEIDLSGYTHALRDNDIRHIFNSHG